MAISAAPTRQIHEAQKGSALRQMGFPHREARGLAERLERVVEGEVRFDAGSRALYSRDGSNYRQIPIGVVVPRSADDVLATMALCREFGAPILARGGGTSLAGQCCNVAVVLDFSKYMNRILEFNVEEKWARVEPGLILDHLNQQTTHHNLAWGPDPSTHNHCTFGGMLGNNSCGVHSVMAGRSVDNLHEMEIVTYEGLRMHLAQTSDEDYERIVRAGGPQAEIYSKLRDLRDHYADAIRERFPDIPRRVSGYCLDELLPEKGFHVARSLVGTECTCALLLEAKVRLIHHPPQRSLLVLCYSDIYEAGDAVPEVMAQDPIGLEGIDDRLIGYMHKKGMHLDDLALFPEGWGGWLLVEFGADTQDQANHLAEKAASVLKKDADHYQIYEDPAQQEKIWEIRESGLGATAFVPGHHDTWPGWEDSAVPPDRLGNYLRDIRKLMEDHGYDCSYYGHFGQGLLHTRIDFELKTQKGLANYRSFIEQAADLCHEYGGSFSGEHGDGQSRGELLGKLYGEELLRAFREFKSIWDPQWKMNPGKVIDADPMDANLVFGTDYSPPQVETHFHYPEDHGNFAHAANRCVGVGKCRRWDGGTMCPSYMVTHEEKHTTRGRARMLYEMMQGDVITDGWQSEEVKEALDLCLACKGCKGDCPVDVDMATYKAEFLSHYYEKRYRPRSAWAMGLIDVWARLASIMPRVVNYFTSAPGFSPIVKWMGGVAQERKMPPFAAEPFTHWSRRRKQRRTEGPPVLLWPDTFNNFMHPETARSATHVLERAGFQVVIPETHVCCGRPLYDYGMLDRAKAYLRKILDQLRPQIQAGIPVVVLEPSCLAVFQDEMLNLFPYDMDAGRLKRQSFTLAQFLEKYAEDSEFPQLDRKAVLHGHCHQKSILNLDSEKKLLEKLGVDFESPETGCCGMAGSFGFESEHYDISIACGERVLLPAVRKAKMDELVIADGFSCQEQIEQQSGRRAMHLAQVLDMAYEEHINGRITRSYPERCFREDHSKERISGKKLLAGTAGMFAGIVLAKILIGRR